MSFDIEHQSARHEKEDVKLPADSSPNQFGSGRCWSSVYPILVKAVAGVVVLLIAFLVVLVAALIFAYAFACAVLASLVFSPVFASIPMKTFERLTGNKPQKTSATKEEAEFAGEIGGMYDRARNKEHIWDRIILGIIQATARAGVATQVWLALSLLVPRLRVVRLLGAPMWKWSLLALILTNGYIHTMSLTFLPIIYLLLTGSSYSVEELMISINNMAYFGLVLGTWLAYFRTHHGLNNHSHQAAFEYVTWTFVSLFVGSTLLLFKNLLLMKWSADAIYRRFEPRIVITSLKYYFIGLLAAHFSQDTIVEDLKVLDLYDEHLTQDTAQPNPNRLRTSTVSKYVMSRKMSLSYLGRVSHILISLGETMSPLLDGEADQEAVVTWFKNQIKDHDTSAMCTPDGLLKLFPTSELQSSSSPKEDVEPPELPTPSPKGEVEPAEGEVQPPELPRPSPKGEVEPAEGEVEPPAERDIQPSELTKRDVKLHELWSSSLEYWVLKLPSWMMTLMTWKTWKRFIAYRFDEEDPKVKEKKKSEDNKKLANVLWRLVGEQCPSHTFTFEDLKMWMVDSNNDCINMGRTLADAKAIVTRLDIFLSFVIFVVVLVLWLLITGVSSTTILVTVATPFLAFTFIFGDSAKTFFQGFIFCFVTHPFDIGDRCILDEIELEVKSISILTTTFTKIGSKEKRLYPNSVLATKAIVNLGWQPDPKDMVELLLDPSTNLDHLEIKITEFFKEKNDCYEETYNLKICEVGEKIKVKIYFSHKLTVQDLSHNQCLKKKSLQQSKFLSIIKKYINESPTERTDSKDPSQCTASTTIELTNAQK